MTRLVYEAKMSSGFAGSPASLNYGYNHWLVQKDTDIVSQNFPNVEGIELHSPAFLYNNTQPGFNNGTQGPTSLDDLGAKPLLQPRQFDANVLQMLSFKSYPAEMNG